MARQTDAWTLLHDPSALVEASYACESAGAAIVVKEVELEEQSESWVCCRPPVC